MRKSNSVWHDFLNPQKTPKENYLYIESLFPNITNYEAVKKQLQRMKTSISQPVRKIRHAISNNDFQTYQDFLNYYL